MYKHFSLIDYFYDISPSRKQQQIVCKIYFAPRFASLSLLYIHLIYIVLFYTTKISNFSMPIKKIHISCINILRVQIENIRVFIQKRTRLLYIH